MTHDGECIVDGCREQAVEADIPGRLGNSEFSRALCGRHADTLREIHGKSGNEAYESMDISTLEVTALMAAVAIKDIVEGSGRWEGSADPLLAALIGPYIQLAMRGHYLPSGRLRSEGET